ncbi:MAG: hypothetical protein IJB85_11800 [Clostridia bacterium]|nr:hypothetical protein [Clostridia bacterium]
MCFLRIMLAAMLICLLPCAVLGEASGVAALEALEMPAEADGQVLDLYCGPTQGFYRQGKQTLNTGEPYVLFGQYDCWAMVAQGTESSFGPIGWVEAGSITDIPYEPQLSFEDGFSAMIEETAHASDNPLADDPFAGWAAVLEPSTQVTVLAQLGDWLYVQAEIEETPARVFVKADTIF